MPRRRDEEALWAAVVAGETPREAGHRLRIRPGRVEYLCNKWASKHIYNWGVVHDLGWVEKWTVARVVASLAEWEQLPTGQRQVVVLAATNAAKVEAVEQVKVDPTTAEASVTVADPGVVVTVQFKPTLESRFPSHAEREGTTV